MDINLPVIDCFGDNEFYLEDTGLYGSMKNEKDVEKLKADLLELICERLNVNVHELKILQKYYKHVLSGEKKFEIRKDDRDYDVGDIILLREWDGESYTGRQVYKRITYILRDAEKFGLKKGYCILSLG